MEDRNLENLISGRYKRCGHGKPWYDREGEYDEVVCSHDQSTGYCGEIECPLDRGGE